MLCNIVDCDWLYVREVIQYVKDPTQPAWRGYMYGLLMFLTAVVQLLFLHQYFYKTALVGMRLRSTICASVYNKVARSISLGLL